MRKPDVIQRVARMEAGVETVEISLPPSRPESGTTTAKPRIPRCCIRATVRRSLDLDGTERP
jgi:hypothetical protein